MFKTGDFEEEEEKNAARAAVRCFPLPGDVGSKELGTQGHRVFAFDAVNVVPLVQIGNDVL